MDIPDGPAPWRSIERGFVDAASPRLGHAGALASPCASCSTSPCCTYLPLHTFQVRTVAELNQAVYLLNFEHIEVGLSPSGDWGVYYRYPCRFLDRQDFTCRIHEQPRQPRICVHYNPHQCWYRRVLTRRTSHEFVRLDRQRLSHLTMQLMVDDDGTIVGRPDWTALVEGIAALPPSGEETLGEALGEDAATAQWKALAIVAGGRPADRPTEAFGYAERSIPCDGCAAHCCKTLVFPTQAPSDRSGLDFLQFALGFEGVELGVTDGAWSLVVRTTCRHLKQDRCSIFGQPERPMMCKYYDAWKCSYRVQFGLPRPPGFVRVRLEEFDWLTECFRFDAFGALVERLPAEAIRGHIEDHWRRRAAQPPAPGTARPDG